MQLQLNAELISFDICSRYFRLFMACFLFLGDINQSTADENWTSFQNGGNIQFEGPIKISSLLKKWDTAIEGYGQSSPVIWNGVIYVTSVSGANKEKCLVTAFDLKEGQKLWRHEIKNAFPQESSYYISKAAPTPVVDKNGIICLFEGGNLIALTHSGELRWERNLVAEYGPIDARHGLAASLEQTAQAVFVWIERQTAPYLLAVKKEDGENLWKSPGLGATSWASPRLIPVDDQKHLVLSGVGQLVGIDPQNGKKLWKFSDIIGNSTPTPIPIGAGRFLMGATVGRGDSDSGRAAESNGILQIRKNDQGEWNVRYLWKAKRATSSFGSPLFSNEHCYFVNRSGVLYCLDSQTGEELYAERIEGSLWATPIAAGTQIILPMKDGTLKVLGTDSNFREIFQTSLFSMQEKTLKNDSPFGGKTIYAGVVTGHYFLSRSGDQLYCYLIENDSGTE